MKKKFIIWIVVLVILLIVASIIYAYFNSSTDDGGLSAAKPGAGCTPNGYECGDCIDNDGDGKLDYKVNRKGVSIGDLNCDSLTDDCESSVCCTPESDVAFCARLGKTCGSVTANDNCGSSRTANCGTCSTGYSCFAGDCSLTPTNNTNSS